MNCIEYLNTEIKKIGILFERDPDITFFVRKGLTNRLHLTPEEELENNNNSVFKAKYYPKTPITKSQFSSIKKFLDQNVDMNEKNHYFVDSKYTFTIQINPINIYRNQKIQDIIT